MRLYVYKRAIKFMRKRNHKKMSRDNCYLGLLRHRARPAARPVPWPEHHCVARCYRRAAWRRPPVVIIGVVLCLLNHALLPP